MIRVDQAGEVGANWIYRGQKWGTRIRGDEKTVKQIEVSLDVPLGRSLSLYIKGSTRRCSGSTSGVRWLSQDMWETEKHHLSVLTSLQTQHNVRPTLLYPVAQGLAFGLGAITALMGKEAAMACTEAVETVIGEHYDEWALTFWRTNPAQLTRNSQLNELKPLLARAEPHPSLPLLKEIITEFRDDELGHLDTAVEEGAQKAPGHSLLSAVIGVGCKGAIWVCEKV
jgi:ubiquinone biosynthesis monooxygenase Coq7